MCSGLCFSDFSDKHLCEEVQGICIELYSDVYGRYFIIDIHDCLRAGAFSGYCKGWWSVLYLGIISTTVCYLLQTACQKYVDETKAAIILSMESVFGTLFSVMILHESITLRMILGCIIILAAVILANSATEEATA